MLCSGDRRVCGNVFFQSGNALAKGDRGIVKGERGKLVKLFFLTCKLSI